MPLRSALLALVLTGAPALVHAQTTTSLRGRFQDITTRSAVSGVAVKMTSLADTSDIHRVTGHDDGSFEVKGLGVHSYKLEATRMGYGTLRTILRVTKSGQDAGVMGMTPESVPVGGITVS